MLSVVSGRGYERLVYNIMRKCTINGNKALLSKSKIGGNTHHNDIILRDNIGIEVKRYTSPDWMQCSLKYDQNANRWQGSDNSKIPETSKSIFNTILKDIDLYDNDRPPLLEYNKWKEMKALTNKWNDVYVDIPSDTIRRVYKEKNCYYIQISNGYGLYHLGEDIYNFKVPIFDIEQRLRIRIKVHKICDKNGNCSLSIMAACQPKNIRTIVESPYSLDKLNRLPKELKYL